MIDKNNKGDSLLASEWLIIGSFLLVMVTLVLIAKIQIRRDSEQVYENPMSSHELCQIEIRGEVARPGIYKVAPGVELKKVLRKSSPTALASLRNINIEQRVEESMVINIEKLSEILVTVIGLSPEPVELVVAPGVRVCDLKSYFPSEFSRKKQIFKSRRVLKDNETIVFEE